VEWARCGLVCGVVREGVHERRLEGDAIRAALRYGAARLGRDDNLNRSGRSKAGLGVDYWGEGADFEERSFVAARLRVTAKGGSR